MHVDGTKIDQYQRGVDAVANSPNSITFPTQFKDGSDVATTDVRAFAVGASASLTVTSQRSTGLSSTSTSFYQRRANNSNAAASPMTWEAMWKGGSGTGAAFGNDGVLVDWGNSASGRYIRFYDPALSGAGDLLVLQDGNNLPTGNGQLVTLPYTHENNWLVETITPRDSTLSVQPQHAGRSTNSFTYNCVYNTSDFIARNCGWQTTWMRGGSHSYDSLIVDSSGTSSSTGHAILKEGGVITRVIQTGVQTIAIGGSAITMPYPLTGLDNEADYSISVLSSAGTVNVTLSEWAASGARNATRFYLKGVNRNTAWTGTGFWKTDWVLG